MDRARRAGSAALVVLVVAVSIAGVGGSPVRAGVVAWPPSTLVVSEVQTGGASASDEFVEVANQGAAAVDLLNLEVVYATSSGSTVRRPGRRPLRLHPGNGCCSSTRPGRTRLSVTWPTRAGSPRPVAPSRFASSAAA